MTQPLLDPAGDEPGGRVLPFPVADPPDYRVADFVRHGELVPVRTDERGDDPTGDAAVVAGLRAQSRAQNTRESYGRHVLAFDAWCAAQDPPLSPLPAAPGTVAAHLAWYALERDPEGGAARDEKGRPIQRVATGTVGVRLAAINLLHVHAGLAPPGAAPEVSQLVAGLESLFGTRPKQRKAAILHEDLAAMLNVAEAGHTVAVRDQLILLLRAARFTAGELTRLTWGGVAGGEGEVSIEIEADGRGGKPVRRVLRDGPGDGDGAPTQVVKALARRSEVSATTPVLIDPKSGKALTRQGITAICNRRAAGLGGYAGIIGAGAARLRPLMADLTEASPVVARDTALLAVGWWLALRRSNLEALRWGDLTFYDDGDVSVLVRRSKTDQRGEGRLKWLKAQPSADGRPFASPTEALGRWRRTLAAQLGLVPDNLDPAMPVFVHLSRTGVPVQDASGGSEALSGDRINDIVQAYAASASLDGSTYEGDYAPYGAHSLRIGFVTEALLQGIAIDRIMNVTDHVSPQVLMRYRRDVDERNHGGVAQLAGILSGDTGAAAGGRGARPRHPSQSSPAIGPPVSRRKL